MCHAVRVCVFKVHSVRCGFPASLLSLCFIINYRSVGEKKRGFYLLLAFGRQSQILFLESSCPPAVVVLFFLPSIALYQQHIFLAGVQDKKRGVVVCGCK